MSELRTQVRFGLEYHVDAPALVVHFLLGFPRGHLAGPSVDSPLRLKHSEHPVTRQKSI